MPYDKLMQSSLVTLGLTIQLSHGWLFARFETLSWLLCIISLELAGSATVVCLL